MPIMFFYFLKIIFDISISKRSKKYKPHSILVKNKKLKFGQKIRDDISNSPQQEEPLEYTVSSFKATFIYIYIEEEEEVSTEI
jgi:hypothetical protein